MSFSMTATATASLSYQRRLNGTHIAGATGSTSSITSVNMTNSGIYTVCVANAFGSATSSNAFLALNVPIQFREQNLRLEF